MGRGDGDEQVVRRIVAMLLSMAGLALRAACAPWPVRCVVLAVLLRAEAVARLYALGDGVSALAPVHARRRGAGDPADLARLALRLRTIAVTLLVAVARTVPVLRPENRFRSASSARKLELSTSPAKRQRPPDTS